MSLIITPTYTVTMSFIPVSFDIARAAVRISNNPRTLRLRVPAALMSTKQSGHKQADVIKPEMDSLKQGHAADSSNLHQKDVQSQSVGGGMASKESSKQEKELGKGDEEQMDAAAMGKRKPKPKDTGSGNPEGVGFVDQVGSASGSAKQFEKR